ncbi:MAG TPA: hypothetical protein DCS12_03975 [Clostridiales bacterium]|nr:hypothetical protein [Clostridiales bacterium]
MKFMYDKIRFIIRKSGVLLINCIIFCLSLLIPKTNKIVVIGGWFGERFADNSKHFFLNAHANKKALNINKVVWITRDKNIYKELKKNKFIVYMAWSLLGIWYHFRAKNHIIDQSPFDINPFFSIRSRRVNLWHGFPLKRIGTYMKNSKIKPKYKSIKWYLRKISVVGCWYDCYVLTTSEFSSKIIGRAFDVSEERTIISGYPRNYIALSDDPLNYIPHNEHYHYEMVRSFKESGYRIIGYFPTFRDKKETLIFGTDQYNEILSFLDLCENLKIKVIGKFHFAGKNDRCIKEIDAHKAFLNLPSDNDLYTFIEQIDLLITDYSSIYFDFLLYNKPIIFFPYDLKYYIEEDRGMIFKYDEYTPGPKAYDLKELTDLLKDGYEKFEGYYRDSYSKTAGSLKISIFDNPEAMGIEHLWNNIITK